MLPVAHGVRDEWRMRTLRHCNVGRQSPMPMPIPGARYSWLSAAGRARIRTVNFRDYRHHLRAGYISKVRGYRASMNGTASSSFIGAIDQGTTSSRFLIFNNHGDVVVAHQLEFTQIYPHPGYGYMSPLNTVCTSWANLESTTVGMSMTLTKSSLPSRLASTAQSRRSKDRAMPHPT